MIVALTKYSSFHKYVDFHVSPNEEGSNKIPIIVEEKKEAFSGGSSGRKNEECGFLFALAFRMSSINFLRFF